MSIPKPTNGIFRKTGSVENTFTDGRGNLDMLFLRVGLITPSDLILKVLIGVGAQVTQCR